MPATLEVELKHANHRQNRVRARFRWALVVVTLVLAVPFMAVAAMVARSDAVIAWLVDWVPPAQEAKLGELVLAQTRAEMKVLEPASSTSQPDRTR